MGLKDVDVKMPEDPGFDLRVSYLHKIEYDLFHNSIACYQEDYLLWYKALSQLVMSIPYLERKESIKLRLSLVKNDVLRLQSMRLQDRNLVLQARQQSIELQEKMLLIQEMVFEDLAKKQLLLGPNRQKPDDPHKAVFG